MKIKNQTTEYAVKSYGKTIGKIEAASEEHAERIANLCYGTQFGSSSLNVQKSPLSSPKQVKK